MIIVCCLSNVSQLESISQVFALATPIILFSWFCYSQYLRYLKNYIKEINGIYAGFVDSSRNVAETNGLNAGIIMYIRDVDDKGFFKGEFEYGETRLTFQNTLPISRPLSAGIHIFLGKLEYQFYIDKSRHPLMTSENRTYHGKLYIIDRLDFQIETTKMQDYLQAEYDILHYREMKILKFTLKKIYKENAQKLPTTFTLYKSGGFTFEPLKGVNDVVFKPLGRT